MPARVENPTVSSRSDTFTNDSSNSREGSTNPASDVHADSDFEVSLPSNSFATSFLGQSP